MPTRKDAGGLGGEDSAEVVTITREEYDRLKAADDINTEPAVETGPHLKDPEIRAEKRKQLKEAGIAVDDDRLNDDLRGILREKGG